MKPILVLGNITCDIIVKIDQVPCVEDDIVIKNQQMQLGGCAFNVAHLLHLHEYPMTLISVVGTGVYGDFIRQQLKQLGYKHRLFAKQPHGCCYCLVDNNGERTFMAHHGVEYTFRKEWLNPYKNTTYAYVYVCGLDIDEACGDAILDYLESINTHVFFAGGPSVAKIDAKKLKRLQALKPIVHLNEREAQQLSGCKDVEQSLYQLFAMFQSLVIVTLGAKGSVAYDGEAIVYEKSQACKVVDTIGAGDAHAAMTLMGIAQNKSIAVTLQEANALSAKVVAKSGAIFTKEEFAE